MKTKGNNLESIIVLFIIAYFIYRGIETAITILPYIGPDEMYHIDLIRLFSYRLGMIRLEDLGSVGFGTPPPYLPFGYHFILGKLLWFNVFNFNTIIYLRILNLGMATGTVLVSYKIFQSCFESKRLRIFALLFLTNIPFFSFLSSMVSYDNMANLLSVLSIYYLLKFNKTYSWVLLLLANIFSLSSALVKETMVPFFLIIGLISIFLIYKNKVRNKSVNTNKERLKLLSVLILFSAVFVSNVNLYGNNIINFYRLVPICQQVQPPLRCVYTKQYQRSRNYREIESPASYPKYLFIWGYVTTKSLMQHGGMNSLFYPEEATIILWFLLLVGGFVGIRQLIRESAPIKIVVCIGLLYSFAISLHVYLSVYLNTGNYYDTVHGRYVFPVITFFIVIMVLSIKKVRSQTLLLSLLSLLLIVSDYFYFKLLVPDYWLVGWHQKMAEQGEIVAPYEYLKWYTHTGEGGKGRLYPPLRTYEVN